MDDRSRRELRRGGTVKVEGKSFEIVWFKGGRKEDEVGIKEKTRKGAYSVTFTVEGGMWLSNLLNQIAEGRTTVGSTFKRIEPLGYLMGTVKENVRGKFSK
ncbi:hypothetical protein FRX31_032419 [Thalictrum thalictroides]|uniref:Uncharacterized protein n=1 Tax=Thalictrum thalictroides TaxID=46969 RepID=A0A7J6UZ96_THATH|nr:hypothetical protein FRX31_032419 [Thalictrum thalictroides]